jgi:glycosyltransferase involved in cell wall biosynthesis
MRELVTHGTTGLHFRAGDAADLAAKVEHFFGDPLFRKSAGCAAREEFERKYTPQRNYEMLMAIYRQTLDAAARPTV